jgi:hypothetical protein
VDDWEQSARYSGGLAAETPLAQWFWRVVRDLDADGQAKLLHFCTGSSKGPVTPPAPTRPYPFVYLLVHPPRVAVSPGKEAVLRVSQELLLLSGSRHLARVMTPLLTRAVCQSVLLRYVGC